MREFTVLLNVNESPIDHKFKAKAFYIDPAGNLIFYDKLSSDPLAVICAGSWVTVERPYDV